ncbi:hypothetical protein [Tateyamaria sp.]|uniref:hypothetical protein n=1 Tax=Tateyamaria sp. TaxID=1929288 RepID=UPI00329FEF53
MSQDVFAARLARLNSAHDQLKEEQVIAAQAERGFFPEWVHNLGYPGSMLLAGVIGFLTVLMSRYVVFHLNGVPGADADADLTMLIDGALAAVIAFVLRTALKMESKEHLACKAAGIWIGLTGMHNLVHAYPTIWENAFSPEWVEYTTELTEPKSFYVAGMSFVIGGSSGNNEDADDLAGQPQEIIINRP